MWTPLLDKDVKKASFVCPECGRWGALLDHAIAADGTVSPSVVCGYGADNVEVKSGKEPLCPFHDFVRLVGWVP